MSKQEFKLRQDLEALVNFTAVSRMLKEASKEKISNELIDSAKNFYGKLTESGLTSFDPLTFEAITHYSFSKTMSDGNEIILSKLRDSIDDETYNKAKGFYLNQLDEQHKLNFYLTMLSEGMIPKKPENADEKTKNAFKALEKAKGELDLAKSIEDAVNAGNIDLADRLVSDNLDSPTLRYLETLSLYGAPAFRNAEKGVYLAVANARRNVAAKMVNDNKLYKLIDKGIEQNPQGKAYSLVGMHNVYNIQMKTNEAKKNKEKK